MHFLVKSSHTWLLGQINKTPSKLQSFRRGSFQVLVKGAKESEIYFEWERRGGRGGGGFKDKLAEMTWEN
jgi:hypothetical protein